MVRFSFLTFLVSQDFHQTRDSDKRDIFEKTYHHPLQNITYNVIVTIYYNTGFTEHNNCSVELMSIEFIDSNKNASVVFSGIAPRTHQMALDLFESITPTLDYIKANYNSPS